MTRIIISLLVGIISVFAYSAGAYELPQLVRPTDATPLQHLAVQELSRYLYLRTGEKPQIVDQRAAHGNAIRFDVDTSLGAQEYRITSQRIAGGSDLGVLYGTYRYAELLGVRFYLHGDVVPDERLKELPAIDDRGTPLFDIRGIQPFHDFPEGPDWWNQDDYLAYVTQLAKMRMNFIGLHCYPEGGVGPEALVWIGVSDDVTESGDVTSSYPAYWKNTMIHDAFNYAAMKTSEFSGGAAELFPADDCGPDVMRGLMPRPQTPADCNELFHRVARQMNAVFTAARQVGVKTCIGTETPLTIPQSVRARSTDVRALYTGMFQRIQRAMPVDYYWLWTPEGWTWSGNDAGQFAATTSDIQAALDALEELGNPFTLATCGWVLGPAHDRAALDAFLPKSSPMSCINRTVGHDGVEPAFANVTGRPKWAIPWMENDPNLVGPQPWVARMRHDAVDARRFGCTGLLGIHWRTKALEMNVAALAAAAWDQSWVPATYDTQSVPPSEGGDGAIGGQTAAFQADIAPIYNTVRFDLSGYDLEVPNGHYSITLQFNEPAYAAAGKRVFGVKIQGQQVVTGLDIFARVGQHKALDLAFLDVAVMDGTLRIEFTKEVEFPCIAGIVVTGQTAAANQLAGTPLTRKINCGGDAVGDYEADRVRGGAPPAAGRDRTMPVEDFYVDYARANFGAAVAEPAGRLLARIDGVQMPEVSTWKDGPGGLVPNSTPWSEVKTKFAFVDELEQLRPQVQGAGNLERFDYWLNTYRAAAAMAELGCLRGQLDLAMAAGEHAGALTTRITMAQAWTRLLSLQAAIVTTPGELGTIANLEQHTRRYLKFLEGHDDALSKALGSPLPPAAQPGSAYTGPAKIIVPTVRSVLPRHDSLTVTILTLGQAQPTHVTLHSRALGHGPWQESSAEHVGRAVYRVSLPDLQQDIEYYITAQTAGGQGLTWPATAPHLNQTVVVW